MNIVVTKLIAASIESINTVVYSVSETPGNVISFFPEEPHIVKVLLVSIKSVVY